jgi:NADH-quinone oxidoreductase subunit A
VIYRDLGAFGLVEVLLFSVAVVVSFAYLLANGALDWGPVKRMQRLSPMVSAERTTSTTVRRVGHDGREDELAPASGEGLVA